VVGMGHRIGPRNYQNQQLYPFRSIGVCSGHTHSAPGSYAGGGAHQETFLFEGNEIVTAYARYLIEYLESKLN